MTHRALGGLATTAAAACLVLGAAPVATAAGPRGSASHPISLVGAFPVAQRYVTVPHRPVAVHVTLPAAAAGGRARLTASLDHRVFKTVTLNDTAPATGRFTVGLRAPGPGLVRVRVVPVAPAAPTATATTTTTTTTTTAPSSTTTPATPTATTPATHVEYTLHTSFTVVTPTNTVGATGLFVKLLQSRLAALHLFIPQTGVLDPGTQLALDAYHRLLGEGEGHTQVDAPTVTDLLDGRGTFHVKFPDQGQHAEGDLSDQVLAFTNGAQVHWLFPISSGKPSTPTVLGNFQVYYKEPNYTPDGMYFSAFFHGGYAIHGYDPAPDFPASHGCMRLPIPDAIPAYNWIQVGNDVDTYYT